MPATTKAHASKHGIANTSRRARRQAGQKKPLAFFSIADTLSIRANNPNARMIGNTCRESQEYNNPEGINNWAVLARLLAPGAMPIMAKPHAGQQPAPQR